MLMHSEYQSMLISRTIMPLVIVKPGHSTQCLILLMSSLRGMSLLVVLLPECTVEARKRETNARLRFCKFCM